MLHDFDISPARLDHLFTTAAAAFPGMVTVTDQAFVILPQGRPLARMVARAFDAYDQTKAQHSAAV